MCWKICWGSISSFYLVLSFSLLCSNKIIIIKKIPLAWMEWFHLSVLFVNNFIKHPKYLEPERMLLSECAAGWDPGRVKRALPESRLFSWQSCSQGWNSLPFFAGFLMELFTPIAGKRKNYSAYAYGSWRISQNQFKHVSWLRNGEALHASQCFITASICKVNLKNMPSA